LEFVTTKIAILYDLILVLLLLYLFDFLCIFTEKICFHYFLPIFNFINYLH
jgi:hypothetical protein